MNENSREKIIVRTSMVGIGVNILLAALKAAIGLLTSSIAVVLDAVNNLSDALSSLITIIGTRLAAKAPDKKHPMGYGRIEYLSALIISIIVLYAGVTSLIESVKKILHPQTPEYSVVSLAILGAAVIAKILLGTYFRKVGNDVNSGSLIASGSDALNDAILSSSVIISAILFMTLGIQLEAFVGVVIAGMIIRSGIELISDTLDELLGKRPDSSLSKAIKATVASEPEVRGAYDLLLTSYGPDKIIGSVHIEVPDTMTADQIDALERRIGNKVVEEHKVFLTGISLYAYNTSDNETKRIQNEITDMVMAHEGVLQVHGFYLNPATKNILFDVVLDYAHQPKELYRTIVEEVTDAYRDYHIQITLDTDLSD